MTEEKKVGSTDFNEIIRQVEEQLGAILSHRTEEIEHELEERINREKEAARLKKEEIEKEFKAEREALSEFRSLVRNAEEERKYLLEEVRERFKKILHYQAEIEDLAKSTGEEIKKLGELQRSLEEIRGKTAEKAALLKKELRDKFGIVTEILEEEEPSGINLDRELERLKRIKEVLAAEFGVPVSPDQAPGPAEEEAASSELQDLEIPEIGELIAEEKPVSPVTGEITEAGAGPSRDKKEASEEDLVADIEAFLNSYRKSEPVDGSGEMFYYQKDREVVIDGEELFKTAETITVEASQLKSRLEEVDSPKEQFFIKQELINRQEMLRGVILRVVRMCEKSGWKLPAFTADLLNIEFLRGMLERLSIENWSNPPEFLNFERKLADALALFKKRLESRFAYLKSIQEALETV